MKRKMRVGLFATVAAAAVICMAASGCSGVLHNEADAAAGIAATLNTAAQVNHNDTFESPEEKAMIANMIMRVAYANDNFIGALKAAEASGGKINTPAVTAAFQALVNTANDLNANGVLKLKSPQAQADFQLAIASIEGALNGMQAMVQPTTTSRNTPPLRGSRLPLLGLALTPAEIEELIALAIAAGSSLVSKLVSLRGETDAQLLASAAADDAAAEKIAASDGAAEPTT